MATKQEIRTQLKLLLGRNFTGIDSVLNQFIDSAVELFASTITSVYDEQRWEHVITAGEVTSKVDNWLLPARTKFLLDAVFINDTGTEPVYYKLEIVSPLDWYSISKLNTHPAFGGNPQYDYSSQIVFGGYKKRALTTRVDYAGIPKFVTRINNNLYVYPRPGVGEIGKRLQILLAVKPQVLVNDTDTNVISNNYADALIYYAGALFWLLHLNDVVRGTQWLNIATAFLRTFANEEEIKKLINIRVKI